MTTGGTGLTPDKGSGPESFTTNPSDTRKHRPRTLRRIAKRKEDRERREALEKFGPAVDERKQPDRRQPKSVDETERILKDMGITDRRRMDRRGRGSW